jgi:serine/threonine protein kinase
MGTVWLCHDDVLGREVAVKQMGALPGEDARGTTRAMREARVTASMNHENAVAVYDVVDHDGGTWLVMEYFPSRTLADLISAEGALSPDRVAHIGTQVAAALSSAHGLGIVHRDVKPGNVLVGEGDRAKISDFGIARGHTDLSLTQTGMMTGTPGYFSPELARGSDPSSASDAWALGATLFTAVEGRPAYPMESNPLAMLSAITREPPAELQRAGALAPVITALMQPDPEQRWTMDRTRDELARIASEAKAEREPDRTRSLPVGAPVATAPEDSFTAHWQTESEPAPPVEARPRDDRRRVWWAAAAVVLLVIGLSAAAWAVLGPDGASDGNDRVASEHKNQSTHSSTGPSTSPETDTTPAPTTNQTPDTPTATGAGKHSPAAAENFVSNYYTLVPGDLDAGWAQLSPDFQAATGREAYDDFWSSYSSVSVSDVHAVSPTVVDYTISYDGSSEENKQITLVTNGSSYLIDSDGQQG